MGGSGIEGLIVIVEDDEDVAAFLEEAVRELAGKRTLLAADGETALALIQQERPLAILLDVMLPGMNGIAVFDELKTDPGTADIPVIFMSCCHEFWREIRKRGAKCLLEKPFSLDQLLSALDEALAPVRPRAA